MWHVSKGTDDPPQLVDVSPGCPVHNSESLSRKVDYARIEEIVRRVVREELVAARERDEQEAIRKAKAMAEMGPA